MNSISSLTMDGLAEQMRAMGQPDYRTAQLYGWLHARQAHSFDEMTNLPAGLRQQLAERWRIDAPEVEQVLQSRDGTQKLLLRLHDGNCVETVVMRYHHGVSVCISSQVGCRMGCAFCASGRVDDGPGFVRGLEAGEMLGQVYAAGRQAGERVRNVVLMGIGEPLDNFDNVMDFYDMLTSAEGYDLSGRHISLSTCGVVPGIRKLAQRGLALTLSISLHAVTDEARNALMLVNKQWPIAELMEACKDYFDLTGRRVSFEYAMLDGVNDSEADAAALAALARQVGAHVNLIAANPVDASPYGASGDTGIRRFAERLQKLGVQATVRRRLGSDIDAACGQLRNRVREHERKEPITIF